MTTTLAGKWAWLWNWRRCDDGDPDRVAARLVAAGCRGAIVKAFDGPYWFDQSAPWRDIADALQSASGGRLAVGGWGYLYGVDIHGEAQRAIETAQYGAADLLVLDVESEFKGRPEAADQLCRLIREALGPDYPIYFSSFAIARYHRSFPFETFRRYCTGAVPQVYWNAFRWPLGQSLAWTYEDYAALGIPPSDVFPAGGLYQEGFVTYPDPAEVRDFIARSASGGSAGVSFWSYEHMSDEMWEAVRLRRIGGEEEAEMSSQEYQQVTRALAEVGARVDRLEARVQSLGGEPALPPPPRASGPPQADTYTVQPGDSLSAIAARLGLPDWHPLYEANAAVIGDNPNLIYPGQVLVLP